MYSRSTTSKLMQALLKQLLHSIYVRQRLNAYDHLVSQLLLENIVEVR